MSIQIRAGRVPPGTPLPDPTGGQRDIVSGMRCGSGAYHTEIPIFPGNGTGTFRSRVPSCVCRRLVFRAWRSPARPVKVIRVWAAPRVVVPVRPMHTTKVIFLLLLTLGLMRLLSWFVGGAVFRLTGWSRGLSSACGNVTALVLFSGYLWWTLAPGESYDLEPFLFGLVVYAVYQLIDLKWYPWSRRNASRASRA